MRSEAEIATRFKAYLPPGEPVFQRRARLLQAFWRAEHELPMGLHSGEPMGTRVDDDGARQLGYNLLDHSAKRAVEARLRAREPRDQLEADRIYQNLLASTSVAFNLFARYENDLPDATSLLVQLLPSRIDTVTRLLWEHNPSRYDPTLTNDGSAFDVFFAYTAAGGGSKGFVGIEVKYHESLKNDRADERLRYREVARDMCCFVDPESPALTEPPLGQIWRNHLLAGAMLQRGDYGEGLFVMLYPAGNAACRSAISRYRGHLTSSATFAAWTIEEVIGVAQMLRNDQSLDEFRRRYLDFARLHAL